jgi:protein-tyrosine phosphatase
MLRVLFVCLGNICRSPTAEGVFRRVVEAAGQTQRIEIDSAGTAAWHIGRPPDKRAQAAAGQRGYDLSGLRGRQVSDADFVEFDYILAMDRDNLADLLARCPAAQRHKVRLFLSFSKRWPNHEVPDPYYGGEDGFNHVLDMVEDAANGILQEVMGV